MSALCPPRSTLERFLAGTLPAREEVALESHVGGCARCDGELYELDRSWLFHALPPARLETHEWTPILAAVRAEVQAHPRRRGPWAWLFPAAASDSRRTWASALAFGLLALVAWVGSSPLTPGAGPVDTSIAVTRAESGFVYLSNPEAEVSQVLVGGRPEAETVLVTMVVDARVADAF